MRSPRHLLVIAAATVLAIGAGHATRAGAGADAPVPTVSGGIGLVVVEGAAPGASLALRDESGAEVATGRADVFGALIFRDRPDGSYTVVGADGVESGPVDVLGVDDVPTASFYADQQIGPRPGDDPSWFGYLETRDGTSLSAFVSLPGPVDEGPYPTLVEYSAYAPSDPASEGFPQLINALGYAYVGVNMRGSGCSGGAYYYFDEAQVVDGYDVVEAVAAQPWVLHQRVGMTGVSYPGISQLFVARTQPPSLVAIAPFSVIDDSYRAVLYPGGIRNTGFGIRWLTERLTENRYHGQPWTVERIDGGDTTCADNQRLRFQNPDLVTAVRAADTYTPALHDSVAPALFADDIEVPVLISGAWQDEQTGSHFATMLDRFTGTDQVYVTLSNGLHTESIGVGSLPRMVEFYDLYVAQRVPSLDSLRPVAPILAESIFGTDDIELPPDRFAGMTYDEALAAFESEPPVLLNLEEGAADGAVPGSPVPRVSVGLDAWPAPETTVARWYLGGDGSLAPDRPAALATVDYRAVPTEPATFFSPTDEQPNVWATNVEWDWRQPDPLTSRSFTTEAFTAPTMLTGSGSVDLWIRTPATSAATDTDLEVTISEVRPDGTEVMIQSGWLRASHRALDDAASTELRPVHTHLATDVAALTPGEWAPVRVEIFPFAHPVRPGSQLRLVVGAPGGNRAEWSFETIADGETVEIATGGDQPSALVLGTLDPAAVGVELPAEPPPCTLRGQPCR